MPHAPASLLQDSIDKLEQLAALLAAEMRARSLAELAPEQRLGKEVLLSISVLLPKLRAAQRCEDQRAGRLCVAPAYRAALPAGPRCASCED